MAEPHAHRSSTWSRDVPDRSFSGCSLDVYIKCPDFRRRLEGYSVIASGVVPSETISWPTSSPMGLVFMLTGSQARLAHIDCGIALRAGCNTRVPFHWHTCWFLRLRSRP